MPFQLFVTNPLASTCPHVTNQQARLSLAKQVGTALGGSWPVPAAIFLVVLVGEVVVNYIRNRISEDRRDDCTGTR